MADQNPTFPDDKRQAAFKDLLEAQDRGVSVPDSRAQIAKQYSITVEEVRAVEKEGIDGQWPPL